MATAADRTWQLELGRLRASGRSAELLGSSAVEWDVLARRADLDGLARRAFANTERETQEFVTAYVDGVNETLATAACPELDFLDVPAGRWERWTPLADFAAQHLLFGTFPIKLWRRHVQRVLGDRGLEVLRDEGFEVRAATRGWWAGAARAAATRCWPETRTASSPTRACTPKCV